MDEKRLAEIEARANAATPGPWEGGTDPHDSTIEGPRAAVAFVNEHKNDRVRSQRGEDYSMADASFIAAARTDVPDLVAEVRRLTAALDAVTTEHAAALDAARREGAEGMREVVKAEIHAAFHYNDPPDDGVERPIGPVPGQWEAHQTLRKLLSRVCAVLTDGGAS